MYVLALILKSPAVISHPPLSKYPSLRSEKLGLSNAGMAKKEEEVR
jgi:hypothetical protein